MLDCIMRKPWVMHTTLAKETDISSFIEIDLRKYLFTCKECQTSRFLSWGEGMHLKIGINLVISPSNSKKKWNTYQKSGFSLKHNFFLTGRSVINSDLLLRCSAPRVISINALQLLLQEPTRVLQSTVCLLTMCTNHLHCGSTSTCCYLTFNEAATDWNVNLVWFTARCDALLFCSSSACL